MKWLTGLILILVSSTGMAADGPSIEWAKLGEISLEGARKVILTQDELDPKGEAVLYGEADGGEAPVQEVEVSLDGGRGWQRAEGRERWEFSFRPFPDETYRLAIRVRNAAGDLSDYRRFGVIEVKFFPGTLSELLQGRLYDLALAYMGKDLEGYMALISRNYKNYPRGWHRLRKAIDTDFKFLNNIVLRFTVNQVLRTEELIMAEAHWKLTYGGLPEPKEGYAEIHFDPKDDLKILLQRKDLYFSQPPIGHDARVSVQLGGGVRPSFVFTVTDLDRVGAGRITVSVNITGGFPYNNPKFPLYENPPRSGRFTGSRPGAYTSGDRATMTYVDELTADGRRNVIRRASAAFP